MPAYELTDKGKAYVAAIEDMFKAGNDIDEIANALMLDPLEVQILMTMAD